jgi:polar amino acid transport system substrate-binding protein
MLKPIGYGRRLISLILFALAFAATLTPPASAQTSSLDAIQKRGTVRVGWAVWFPYIYRDPKTNEITGVSVDLAQSLAKELGVKLVLEEDNWNTLIAGLQSNKYDLTIPIAVTLPRAKAATFTTSILKSGVGLMVPKRDAAKYKSWKDFDKPDMRITTTLGSNVDLFATRAFKQAQILRVKGGPESLMQVMTGKAQAWANTMDAFVKIKAEQPDLVVVPGSEFGFSQVAFSVRAGDFHFRDWLNYFIVDQKDSGALLKTIEKYGLDKTYLAD